MYLNLSLTFLHHPKLFSLQCVFYGCAFFAAEWKPKKNKKHLYICDLYPHAHSSTDGCVCEANCLIAILQSKL